MHLIKLVINSMYLNYLCIRFVIEQSKVWLLISIYHQNAMTSEFKINEMLIQKIYS